jgi:D-methionine transport system permease protein
MAGIPRGEGIGAPAIRFGYCRYETGVVIVAVLILLLAAQMMQLGVDKLSAYFQKYSFVLKTNRVLGFRETQNSS